MNSQKYQMKELFRGLDLGRTEKLDINSFRLLLEQCSIPLTESGKNCYQHLTRRIQLLLSNQSNRWVCRLLNIITKYEKEYTESFFPIK